MRRWLPEPPDLGPFSFRPGGSFPGGMAHVPGEPGRVAVFRPGDPLPDGWRPGPPPPMDVETWARWARAMDRERDPWR